MLATTISIATHKGGTGKTVSAMAIASTLARAGHKTLLVDLDPQGHSTIGLGLELTDGAPTVRDIFVDGFHSTVTDIRL
jgi:chromosome partitioning protein